MKAVVSICFLFLGLAGFSQRQYYVLVESEKSQPFYVRIGETIHNSSAVGHVILSQLADSSYTFEIGFPKDEYPANQFLVKINRRDHGFQLKNMAGKGWALFDLQSAELIYPIKKEGIAQTGYSLVKKDDGFARLLARVVNDSSVLYSIVYEKPVEPVVKNENKVSKDTVVKKEPVVTKEPVKPPAEVRILPAVALVGETQSDSGKHLVYKDDKDRISIFIPAEQTAQKQTLADDVPDGKKENSTKPVVPKADIPVVISATAMKDTMQKNEPLVTKAASDSVQKQKLNQGNEADTQQKKLVIVNSDCKAIAWDNDVDKLRIKMLAEKDVDNKINAARKIFKTKCFSSNQIKGLTELFVTDQDKYKFLDAAYPFVVDTENFKQLSFLLTDDYYVKRFRAMVRMD
jgi:hypothetical protein